MKLNAVILAVSIAANAALAGSVVWLTSNPDHSKQVNRWFRPAGQAPAMATTSAASGSSAAPNQWAQLKAGDLKSQVERLRAAGFPPNVVRAVISAQVHSQFRSQRAELLAKFPPKPYWLQRPGATDPKLAAALRESNKAEKATVKDLVGPNEEPDLLVQRYQEARFGNLPDDVASKIKAIDSDYQDLKNSIYQNSFGSGGVMLPSDQKQLQYLQQQEEQDLAKSMTPEQYQEYQMRSSSLANSLHNSLSAFQPTEDEYKTIFQIEQNIKGLGSPNLGFPNPTDFTQQAAQQQQISDQLAAALGPDRYAQYQMTTDQSYRAAYNIAQRLDLPAEAPAQVYALQQQFTQQAAAIRANTDLSAEDRNAQLAALGQQATTQVTAILGQDGTAGYMRQGGSWIQRLQTRSQTITLSH